MANKIVKGAALIGIAGIIVKFLGAFFRIPLTNIIGDVGMSYYSFAYIIYSVLLVLSTAGLPIAISRLVSENIAQNKYKNAHKVFRVSLLMMLILGVVTSSICFFGSKAITSWLGNPDANWAVKAIAPALLFVPLASAFRGYFQGRQNMAPTAISEIVEQFFRVVIGLLMTLMLMDHGEEITAGGASFGASAGSFASLFIIWLIYLLNRRVFKYKNLHHLQEVENTWSIVKKITIIAIPIIIGSELVPIMSLIDINIIMNRLVATGWTYEKAKALYGLLGGFCNSLIAFPQIFTQAVAISLVPAVARASAVNNEKKLLENISLGYRTTMIMAFPCAIGLIVLAKPIMFLLYPLQKASGAEAAPTLVILALGIVSLAASQTSTGILQAIGKQVVPVKNLLIGGLFKIAFTYALVSIPALNIKGAAIGTIIAETISFILNDIAVRKYTGIKINYVLTYVRPFCAAALMGVSAFFIHLVASNVLGNAVGTLLAIAGGGLIYVIMVFALKAISLDELAEIKGFDRIIRKVKGKLER